MAVEPSISPRLDARETRRLRSWDGRSGRSVDLRRTPGFLVVDLVGRNVGRVEGLMYGSSHETPDALSVRFGFLGRRRRLVPAASIREIDAGAKVIGLGAERDAICTFL